MADPAGNTRRSGGMRALLAAVIIMGVLIVGGTVALFVLIARRISHPRAATPSVAAPAGAVAVAGLLDEPAGTHIVGTTAFGDRLALLLQGGGPDRVVVVDPASGRVVARIGLAR